MTEKMEPVKPSKLMMRMVIIAALFIMAVGVVYYRSLAAVPFALGVLITSGLNILKVRMLEKTVQKVVHMDDQEAGKNVVRLQYLLRYLLTGVVLVVVGLISNYTSPPPSYSSREAYLAVWEILFPTAPEALLKAPLISVWGALAGVFTLQLSVIMLRFMKLEKDGDNFIKYEEDEDDNNENETHDENDKNNVESVESDDEENVDY